MRRSEGQVIDYHRNGDVSSYFHMPLPLQQLAYGLAYFLSFGSIFDSLIHWGHENEQTEELYDYFSENIGLGEISFYSFRQEIK